MSESISEFVRECKDMILIMKQFKKQIKVIVPIKEQELGFYKHFVNFLVKYEELNAKALKSNNDPSQNLQLVIGEGSKLNLQEKLKTMVFTYYL